jgi:hypothetical protein
VSENETTLEHIKVTAEGFTHWASAPGNLTFDPSCPRCWNDHCVTLLGKIEALERERDYWKQRASAAEYERDKLRDAAAQRGADVEARSAFFTFAAETVHIAAELEHQIEELPFKYRSPRMVGLPERLRLAMLEAKKKVVAQHAAPTAEAQPAKDRWYSAAVTEALARERDEWKERAGLAEDLAEARQEMAAARIGTLERILRQYFEDESAPCPACSQWPHADSCYVAAALASPEEG